MTQNAIKAVASWAPLGEVTPSPLRVHIDEAVDPSDATYLAASNNVSAGYFEMLGIPLIAGRFFDGGDVRGSTDVIVLNESMARAYFSEGDEPLYPDFANALEIERVIHAMAEAGETGTWVNLVERER